MKSMRRDFSTHPYHPLSELEVFTGYIFNPTTDAQTRQQRDRSAKLKEAFDGLTRWIVQGEIRGRTRARMQSKDASGAATVAASATKTGPAFRLKSAGGSDAHAEYDNDDDSSDSDSGSGALLSVATSIGGSVSGRAAGDGAGHGSNDRSTAAKGVGNHRAETSSAALPKAFDADSWSNVGSYGYISKGNGTQGLASTAVGPERVEALRTAIACFFIALQDGFEDDSDDYYGGGSSSQKRNKVESFKIVAASIALKELEAVVRGLRALRHSREGDDGSSRRPRAARTGGAGGFVGVRG